MAACYMNVSDFRVNGDKFYYGYYHSIYYTYACTSSHQSLSECSETSFGPSHGGVLGVRCKTSTGTHACMQAIGNDSLIFGILL